MREDYFSHTVTLLLEHSEQGAFGLVINRPLDADLAALLADHDIECNRQVTLLESGPIEQERLFFLHGEPTNYADSIAINDQVALSTSLDVVENISANAGPTDLLAGLGYAGWGGGQLESEILANVWLVIPYAHDIVFRTPFDQRPEEAARSIGVDLNLIAPTPGHG